MEGTTPPLVTVKVAALLVTEPSLLDTTASIALPVSLRGTLNRVKGFTPNDPAIVVPFLSQLTIIGNEPTAVTLKVALLPSSTVTL
jgi:hypothetical protein